MVVTGHPSSNSAPEKRMDSSQAGSGREKNKIPGIKVSCIAGASRQAAREDCQIFVF